MWIPDVYHGSLITTTLLLSSVPKIAVFIILIKLLGLVFSGLEVFWSDIMKILAVLSIIIGNITAIAQTNIKRMLAYSTIANICFILLALSIGSYESFIAAMFYTVTYVITTILAFGLLSQLLSDNNGSTEHPPTTTYTTTLPFNKPAKNYWPLVVQIFLIALLLCLFVNYKSFKCVIAAEVLVQIVLVHELKSTQVSLLKCL